MPMVPRYNVNMYAIAKNIKHDDNVLTMPNDTDAVSIV